MIRTTIQVTPSVDPTVVSYGCLVSIGDPVTGKTENKPEIRLAAPPDGPNNVINFVVEAEKGKKVMVLIASRDNAGNDSQAIPFRYEAEPFVRPLAPGTMPTVRITGAVATDLPVIQ